MERYGWSTLKQARDPDSKGLILLRSHSTYLLRENRRDIGDLVERGSSAKDDAGGWSQY